MKRFTMVLLLAVALFAVAAFAQEKPNAAPKVVAPADGSVSAGKPPAALKISNETAASAEFLAKYDEFITLNKARASAEKRRADSEAAVRVLDEQIAERAAELRAKMAQEAAGSQFDPAKRAFVKPAPPAKAPEPKP